MSAPGSHQSARPYAGVLPGADRSGAMQPMTDLVDKCVAEYDENGWC
jgi:hypothetical protein